MYRETVGTSLLVPVPQKPSFPLHNSLTEQRHVLGDLGSPAADACPAGLTKLTAQCPVRAKVCAGRLGASCCRCMSCRTDRWDS